MARLGRWIRNGLIALAVVVVAALAFLRSPPGQSVTAGVVQSVVQGILGEGWTLDRPGVRWTFDGRVTLTDVVFRDPEGDVAIGVQRLDLQLVPGDLVWLRLHGSKARISGVRVAMETDEENILNLVRAFGGPSTEPVDPDAEPWGGLPFDIVVDDLELRDGLVSLWSPAADDGDPPGFAAKVLTLAGGVELPRYTAPKVVVRDAHLRGQLLHPGPGGVTLDGDVVWTGEGVRVDHAQVATLGTSLRLHGRVDDLFGAGDVKLALEADRLDLNDLDHVFGAGTAGVYVGGLEAEGSLAGLSLSGALVGDEGTRGTLTVREGTRVCLPVGGAGPDACGAEGETVGASPPLRWNARLGVDGFHLEDVLPVVGGPLRLEGQLGADGGGTSWPDGVVVEDGRWRAEDLDVYGVPIRAADLAVGLEEGTLGFPDLELTAVVGTVRGDGSFDLTDGALDLDLRGDLVLPMLTDLGVDQLGGTGTFEARLHGDVYEDGAPITISGRVDGREVTWEDEVRVAAVDGPFSVDIVDGVVEVGANLVASGVSAYGAGAGAVALSDLQVVVDPRGVVLRGRLSAPEVTYDTFVRAEQADAVFEVGVPYEDDVRANVDLVVEDHEVFGFLGTDGAVVFDMVGDDVVVDTDLRYEGDPFVVAPELRIDLATLTLELDELLVAPTWRQRWRNDGPLRLRITDAGGLADAQLALVSDVGRLEMVGTLGTTGPLGAQLEVTKLDLDALAELFPDQVSGLDGVVDLEATVGGDASRPTAFMDLTVEDLFVDGVLRWFGLDGSIRLADDRLTVAVNGDVAGTPLMRADGFVPVRSDLSNPGLSDAGRADLRVVVAPGPLKRFTDLVPSLSLPEGQASGVVGLSEDIADPDLLVQVTTALDVPGLDDRLRVEADVRREDADLTAVIDGYRGFDRVLRTDATATTRLGDLVAGLVGTADMPPTDDLSLYVDDLDLDALLEAVPVDVVVEYLDLPLSLGGTLDGFVRLHGDPMAPAIEAEVEGPLRLAQQAGRLRLSTGPEGVGQGVDLRLGSGGDTWLAASGLVPVRPDFRLPVEAWSSGTFDITVDGEGIPLAVAEVVDPNLEVTEGRVKVQGQVLGELFAPVLAGRVRVEGGAARYRPLGIAMRNLDVRVDARPQDVDTSGTLRLTHQLSFDTKPIDASIDRITPGGTSRFEGGGTVTLAGWMLDTILGRYTASSVWLLANNKDQLRVSGDLRAGGSWPDLNLGGDLDVNQARVALNTSDLMANRTDQLDDSITVHRGDDDDGPSQDRADEDDVPSMLDDLSVDVTVDLGRNTNLALSVPLLDSLGAFAANTTRAEIDARLGGAVDVRLAEGDLSIVGNVETLAGSVDILAASFALERGGGITFLGEDYANPALDIAGSMSVTGGELRVRLEGTALDPEFTFESDDFGSDAALFTVLLTGRAPDELSANQGASAAQAVSELLLQSALQGVNLGSVSVEPDGTVSIGLPVYRTVFVETRYDPSSDLRENSIEVEAEWSIQPRLILDAVYGDQLVWGNLFYEIRYTTLCDRLRDEAERTGGDVAAVDAGCRELARKARRARQDAAELGDADGP